jgi:hypothetical protein
MGAQLNRESWKRTTWLTEKAVVKVKSATRTESSETLIFCNGWNLEV